MTTSRRSPTLTSFKLQLLALAVSACVAPPIARGQDLSVAYVRVTKVKCVRSADAIDRDAAKEWLQVVQIMNESAKTPALDLAAILLGGGTVLDVTRYTLEVTDVFLQRAIAVNDEGSTDDLYIKVDGKRVWPSPTGHQAVRPGEVVPIGLSFGPVWGRSSRFLPGYKGGSQHLIELWEYDSGSDDDSLGVWAFEPKVLGVMTFTVRNTDQNSIYLVEVDVFLKPPPERCQELADSYGIWGGKGFGLAPADARTEWIRGECNTMPHAARRPWLCQQFSDTHGIVGGGTWGSADAEVQGSWIAMDCNTRPTPSAPSPPQPGFSAGALRVQGSPSGLTVQGQAVANGTPIILHPGLNHWKMLSNGAIVLADNERYGLTVQGQAIQNGSRIILHEGYNLWTVLSNGSIVLKDNPKFGLTLLNQGRAAGTAVVLHEGCNQWDRR